jgi:hypothetical protein
VGTFVAAAWFSVVEIDPLTRIFLSENLFIPLVCIWTLLLCRMAIERPARLPIGAAVVGGVATLTRSTLLLAWAPVLAVLAYGYRKQQRSVRPVIALAVAACLVMSVATARNWIVSRKFVFVTSSFGAMLRIGNQPPPGYPRHDPAVRHLLEFVSRDVNVVDTLEFAVEAPRTFLKGLGRKAAYTLGWFPVLDPNIFKEGDAKLIATWALALVGVGVWIARRRPPPYDSALAAWLPLLVSFTHFASVVSIIPSTYVRRMILPLYVLLLPYAGLALSTVALALGVPALSVHFMAHVKDRKRAAVASHD